VCVCAASGTNQVGFPILWWIRETPLLSSCVSCDSCLVPSRNATCNRDWIESRGYSISLGGFYRLPDVSTRVCPATARKWWLRLLLPTTAGRPAGVPCALRGTNGGRALGRRVAVGRDLVNRQALPVQPTAIARAILVPSLSPTSLSSSAPPESRSPLLPLPPSSTRRSRRWGPPVFPSRR
jgi:hypothetical protein